MLYHLPFNKPYSINPYNGETLAYYEYHAVEQIDRLLEQTWNAYKIWQGTTLSQRCTALLQISNEMERQKEVLAQSITLEMGKILAEAVAEVEKSILCLRYYAEQGEQMLAEYTNIQQKSRVGYRKENIGPLLAIMPWNFPIWQVIRVLAPAFLVGNTVVLKHADNTPQCAEKLEKIIEEATGFPSLLTVVRLHHKHIEHLIGDWRIKAVTLTGSEAAGRNVGMLAGKHLKKSVLELGGNDAFIVLKDADMAHTTEQAAYSRLICNGQSCIAANRFIVQEEVYDDFLHRLTEAFNKIKPGNPLSDATTLGPLARPDLAQKLADQVSESIRLGAKAAYGKPPLLSESNFFLPTILVDVLPGMPAFDDELFGPVAAVIKAKDEQHAIQLANHSRYGLGASIWTTDRTKAASYIPEIEAGMVFVNSIVRSDPTLPFGGTKASGYGRELGEQGVMEFANIKTFSIT